MPKTPFRFLLALAMIVGALGASSSADPTRAAVTGNWAVDQTRAQVGESRMLVFAFDAPSTVDAEFTIAVEPASAMTVLHPLRVLAGYEYGFARVRPEREGAVTVRAAALNATCIVDVQTAPPSSDRPQMITPSAGAVVWGSFAAAAFVPGSQPDEVTLRTRSGAPIATTNEVVEAEGGYEATFDIDATALPEGECAIIVEAHRPDAVVRSEPTVVRVVHPADGEVDSAMAVELALLPLPDDDNDEEWEQPEWFSESPSAPSGTFVVHAEPWPMTRMPVETGERGGWYQMAIIARGDPAGGIWPEIAVTIDNEEENWQTQGTLVREGWHRVIIGGPVWVPPGEHRLTPFFSNDFWVERAFDRNLYLDTVELLPVAAPPMPRATIAFATPLDGMRVHGAFELQAVIARDGRNYAPPPLSVLSVNGKAIARQRSDGPRFRVGTADLQTGANEIVVHTEVGGVVSAQASATVHWHGEHGRKDGLIRLTASEPGWTGDVPVMFDEDNPDGRTMAFTDEQTARLELPAGLEGRFELGLFVRGTWWDDEPAEVEIRLDGDEIEVIEVEDWWHQHEVGSIRLDGGAHTLEIEFLNPAEPDGDHDEGEDEGEDDEEEFDEEDEEFEEEAWWWEGRRFFLSAVELRPVDIRRDRTGPEVEWVYPAEGATIGLDDAVIVDVSDASGVAGVRVFVDGEPLMGGFVSFEGRLDGRVCIPIALRVEPGPHSIFVEAYDRDWRDGGCEPRQVQVTDNAATPYARAVHLLNRLGYGPEPRLLRELLTSMDWHATLAGWLRAAPDARAEAVATWRFFGLDWAEAALRAMDIGLHTDNPVRYRAVMFLENHFTTWLEKTGGHAEWDDWQRFNRVGAGRFRDALFGSATSPAMLTYLDNARSFAHTLNENYARELLELHTLGVDNGYTQADVTALAHVLTGWSTAAETEPEWPTRFAFHHRVHDRGQHDVVGYRFDALPARSSAVECRDRGVRALEVLAAHPGTAEFIARKLIENYLVDPAPPALEAALAKRFLESDGDIAEVLLALAQSDAFWNAMATPRGNDPLCYGLRAMRCGEVSEVWYLFEFLERAQRLPMHHPTPDGYPVAPEEWLDSAGMHARFGFAAHVCEFMMWRLFMGPERWEVEEFTPAWNQALIDHVAQRLTGKRLAARQNQIALDMLADVDEEMESSERVGLVITFVLQMPAANTN